MIGVKQKYWLGSIKKGQKRFEIICLIHLIKLYDT